MKEYNLKHYAHIGDAVWEIFIRLYSIEKSNTQKGLHELTVSYVNADFQAKIHDLITDELKSSEKEILKRGQNLPLSVNKKNKQSIHRHATALEVLVGFLYLNDKKRLNELFEIIKSKAL